MEGPAEQDRIIDLVNRRLWNSEQPNPLFPQNPLVHQLLGQLKRPPVTQGWQNCMGLVAVDNRH